MSNQIPEILHLRDRGSLGVAYYDLFAESKFGADNLFLIDRYNTLAEVKASVETILLKSPVEQYPTDNILSFNRFSIPDKKFWVDPHKDDPFPKKANNMITFLLRVKYYGDFVYFKFGKKWPELDIYSENYPIGDKGFGAIYTLDDMDILSFTWISYNDVTMLLSALKAGKSDRLPDEIFKNIDEKQLPQDSILVTNENGKSLVIETKNGTSILTN